MAPTGAASITKVASVHALMMLKPIYTSSSTKFELCELRELEATKDDLT